MHFIMYKGCILIILKDISNFNGSHSDGSYRTATANIVHHDHEEVTARDLLDHKRPKTNKKKTVTGLSVYVNVTSKKAH